MCNNALVSLFRLCALSVSSSTALIPEARVQSVPPSLMGTTPLLVLLSMEKSGKGDLRKVNIKKTSPISVV